MMCAANPCLAQDQMGFGHRPDQQAAAFAGMNLRLEIGRQGRPKPVARLAIGRFPGTDRSDIMPGPVRSAAPGLELGLTRGGAAALYVGGEPASRVKERLGANRWELSPAAIAFGVVLVGVGVLVITNLDDLGDDSPAG
jgi:hypothetical protein